MTDVETAFLGASVVAMVWLRVWLVRQLHMTNAAPVVQSGPRWREPTEFKCPACGHWPTDHYAERHKRQEYYGCGARVTNLASSKSCLCVRSQDSLLAEAEAWSYQPPPTSVLMHLFEEPLKEVEPEPKLSTESWVPITMSVAERERFRAGVTNWPDKDQPWDGHRH